ncbi:hypothetical protein P0D29_02420 [Mycoplasmoides gallisepticum]|uniref:hypothetical protein n=1 Tax=Mycoplasmoides gallisepticum TaxID=2096 RepID=UPI0024466D70|nr:hypothetical protein [Mycoplasmoides gallisepticum]WGG25176.1 hypothetical protein P0D29_02420 [Mycoplasmoides gallisepticum]
MKRKNILKFVSLLGIGSFLMLAAASCTTPVNPTPNPTPNPEPKPDPTPNPPSGGMNGGNTNPGNGGQNMMDTAAQELANAKTALTALTNSESEKVGLYVDYAKISAKLSAAYTSAKNVLNNSASTTQNINAARTTLETEIAAAAKAKTDFDAQHGSLVEAYNNLKETLKEEKTNLDSLANENYAAIRTDLNSLYEKANTIVTATLDPATGNIPEVMSVTQANQDITNATSRLVAWKQNADNLANSFIKQSLVKNNLTGVDQANNLEQPGNYSFVGFSVDVDTPNWSFAQRKIWASENTPLATTPAEDATQQAAPLTDVSWIYSLNDAKAKYTLSFRYFGAEKTAYLYFPYKLVKTSDNVGLQYKLNGGDTKQINFVQTPASGSSDDAAIEEETMASPAEMQPAPTVDDIKIAKVALSNLNFNSNTIEFSVPANKVAPMIGNMYLTSSNAEVNKNKIYDDIFGNTFNNENNPTAVTVDLLKGYSLAASYSIYVRQFNELNIQNSNDMAKSPTVYLVGLIGSNASRSIRNLSNVRTSPNTVNANRTFTIYVNAPKSGDYYLSGSYLTNQNRNIKFLNSSSDQTSSNSLTLNVKAQTNWETLGNFDTSNNTNIVTTSGSSTTTGQTLNLKQGLNKIVISGVGNDNTPFIGNLTFTSMDKTASPVADNTIQEGSKEAGSK